MFKAISGVLTGIVVLVLSSLLSGCGPSKSELKFQNTQLKEKLKEQKDVSDAINTEFGMIRDQLKTIAEEKAKFELEKKVAEARSEERKKAEKDWEEAWKDVEEAQKALTRDREELERVKNIVAVQKQDLEEKTEKLAEEVRKEDARQTARETAEIEAIKLKDEIALAKLEVELAELEERRKSFPTKFNTEQKKKKTSEIAKLRTAAQQRQQAARALSVARSAQMRMLNPQRFTSFAGR